MLFAFHVMNLVLIACKLNHCYWYVCAHSKCYQRMEIGFVVTGQCLEAIFVLPSVGLSIVPYPGHRFRVSGTVLLRHNSNEGDTIQNHLQLSIPLVCTVKFIYWITCQGCRDIYCLTGAQLIIQTQHVLQVIFCEKREKHSKSFQWAI